MEKDTHQIYSDNFDLRVVDLTQIDIATDEDKAYQIDYWATLFKAKTWRDLKMLAERDNVIAEKDNAIAEKDALIAQLQAQLAQQEK